MTRLFRSKSCGLVGLTEFNTAPPSPFFNSNNDEEDEDEDEEEKGSEFEEQVSEDEALCNPISTPFITSGSRACGNNQGRQCHQNGHHQHHQFAILDILVAALRKSIVTCSVEREDVSSSLDISSPTEVRHVSHVTFDRFNGFLGLPTELEPEVPRRVPSARSASSSSSSYNLVKHKLCEFANMGLGNYWSNSGLNFMF